MSTSLCGKICITPAKYIRKERGCDFYSRCTFVAVTSAMYWRRYVFRCESETTLFGLPKEDITRNQWLSCIYNTVPEQFNLNTQMCAAHFTEDCFLPRIFLLRPLWVWPTLHAAQVQKFLEPPIYPAPHQAVAVKQKELGGLWRNVV